MSRAAEEHMSREAEPKRSIGAQANVDVKERSRGAHEQHMSRGAAEQQSSRAAHEQWSRGAHEQHMSRGAEQQSST